MAVTRATYLDNVYFYKYDDTLKDDMIKDYFTRTCEGYKRQDRMANRKVTDGYIDAAWFMDPVKSGSCCPCGTGLSVSVDGGLITSNITAQMLNNEISHTIDNCIPMCLRCNVYMH